MQNNREIVGYMEHFGIESTLFFSPYDGSGTDPATPEITLQQRKLTRSLLVETMWLGSTAMPLTEIDAEKVNTFAACFDYLKAGVDELTPTSVTSPLGIRYADLVDKAGRRIRALDTLYVQGKPSEEIVGVNGAPISDNRRQVIRHQVNLISLP